MSPTWSWSPVRPSTTIRPGCPAGCCASTQRCPAARHRRRGVRSLLDQPSTHRCASGFLHGSPSIGGPHTRFSRPLPHRSRAHSPLISEEPYWLLGDWWGLGPRGTSGSLQHRRQRAAIQRSTLRGSTSACLCRLLVALDNEELLASSTLPTERWKSIDVVSRCSPPHTQTNVHPPANRPHENANPTSRNDVPAS